MSAITADARSRLSYCYFYLLGMPGHVRFTRAGFEAIDHVDPFRTLLPLIVDGLRLVIDLGDSAAIDPDVFDWADGYGKVNATAQQVAAGVVPLGPGFGVRPPLVGGLRHTMTTPMPLEGRRAGLAERRNLWRRAAPLGSFVPGTVQDDYLFNASSLWEWEDTQATTNRWRAEWMRVARENPRIVFEGGFLARPNSELGPPSGPQEEEFADLLLPRRLPMRTWIGKTQRSFAVFNTPAVYGCHGWKLGQFLALGKAIVSTPLSRELPGPLRHGEHLHIVSSTDELAPAMELLRTDVAYRRHLEQNARRYWDEFLRPELVFARLRRAASAPSGAEPHR